MVQYTGKITKVEWIKADECQEKTYWLLSVLSIGAIPIAAVLDPGFGARLKHLKSEPRDADFIIASVYADEDTIKEFVASVTHYENGDEYIVSMEVNCQRYVASSKDNYEIYQMDDVPINFKRFLRKSYEGFSESNIVKEREILSAEYGLNEMTIPTPTTFEIYVRHAFNPIILFGDFAAIIWYVEDYYWYASLVVVVVVLTLIAMVETTKYNLRRLRELAGKMGRVEVIDPFKKNSTTIVPDNYLVVGDHFKLTEGLVLPCDAVLLSGRVVADESMLTGESVPVAKIPIDVAAMEVTMHDEELHLSSQKAADKQGALLPKKDAPVEATVTPILEQLKLGYHHTPEVQDLAEKFPGSILYAGTRIKHCVGGNSIAVTYRTGFRSAKGQLVSSLVDVKEGFLQFFDDMIAVIFLIFILASLLFIYDAYYFDTIGESSSEIAILYFDVLTVAIPIALAFCIIAATALAVYRLNLKEIYVSDTSRINYAGIVDCVCFDKTGTLTEETMEFKGAYVSSAVVKSQESKKSFSLWGGGSEDKLGVVEYGSDYRELPLGVLQVMGVCHSLSLVGSLASPVGDPMEAELLRATAWTLHIDPASGRTVASPSYLSTAQKDSASLSGKGTGESESVRGYEILRHFEFTSDRMRTASLVCPYGQVGVAGSTLYVVKGSPETIVSLCDPSTVPPEAAQVLAQLTKRGWRVLAMAYRSYSEAGSTLMARTQVQLEGSGQLIYMGLIALASKLKKDTKPTISSLLAADIHVNMITGDHVYTAISVAYECGILMPPPAVAAAIAATSLTAPKPAAGEGDPESATSTLSKPALDYTVYIVDVDQKGNLQLTDGVTDEVVTDVSISQLLQRSFSSPALQLAVTGRSIAVAREQLPPAVLYLLLSKAVVFARAKPNDKKFIVEKLIKGPPHGKDALVAPVVDVGDDGKKYDDSQDSIVTGTVDGVMFCGDGANDMAALRAASVGVSLCEVETSIAAPITAKNPTPGVVVEVLLEGRNSLINAYVLVHFNILYALIQLLMTCLLYGYGIMVSDSMYYIQGWAFTLLPGIVITLTPAAETLSPELPPRRYFSPELLTVLISQGLIFTAFQVGALYMLAAQSFYTRYSTDDPLSSTYSYEATTLENVVLGQLMIASVVATIGYPFRKEWYENPLHVSVLFLQLIWLLYQIFAGDSYFAEDILDLKPVPEYFSYYIIALLVGNAAVSGLFWMLAVRLVKGPLRGRKRIVVESLELANAVADADEEGIKAAKKKKIDEYDDKIGGADEAAPLVSRTGKT